VSARMERAKRLLATSSMSMKQIAPALGYARQHFFSRQFRQRVGCTPTEYRRRCGAGGRSTT